MIVKRLGRRRVFGHLCVLGLALISPNTGSQSVQPTAAVGGQISGRVTAPAGVSVEGTLVIACVLLDTKFCDKNRTGGVTLKQPGPSAAHTVTGLKMGRYRVLALKVSVDPRGEVSSIDYLGGQGSDQTRVMPGASNIDITLLATAVSAPAPAPTSGPAPAAGQVSAEVIRSWNGRAVGTDIYRIGPTARSPER
jgi:hypothetical protein